MFTLFLTPFGFIFLYLRLKLIYLIYFTHLTHYQFTSHLLPIGYIYPSSSLLVPVRRYYCTKYINYTFIQFYPAPPIIFHQPNNPCLVPLALIVSTI